MADGLFSYEEEGRYYPSSAKSGYGSKALATIAGIAGGPIGTGVGILGRGISYFLNRKREDELRAKEDKRYKERVAEDMRRWNIQNAARQEAMRLDRSRLKMSQKQLANSIQQQEFENNNYLDERNEQRATRMTQGLNDLMNTGPIKNEFLSIWEGK